ncbi:MAG: iron ABC transporter permease [Firmicutes bacterium]|nr:iron ABC transporter permease [Bacillota bacterium]
MKTEKIEEFYSQFTARKVLFLLFLLVAVAVSLLAATVVGAARISVGDSLRVVAARLFPFLASGARLGLAETVVMDLRLPRALLAVIAGMSLAGSGAAMQAILRNPLADPYILGISAGASFGAAFTIVIGSSLLGGSPGFSGLLGPYVIVGSAFVFGLITMFLIYGVARLKGGGPETLILAGVAIGYLFSAGVSALKYVSGHEQLREIVLWLMGGLAGARWQTIYLLLPLVLGALGLLVRYAWDLNALSAGEEVASNLGVNVRILRRNCAILASLLASGIVAFTGIIGFIGLVSPHICRILIGNDHRFLIPCSGLMGALLLLGADTLARTIISPTELPVGIITSLVGAPFFLYLLFKRRRQCWT